MKKSYLLCALLAGVQGAAAAEWGYVAPVIGKTPAGAGIKGTVEIDTTSVVRSGTLVKAWFRQSYKKDIVNPVAPGKTLRRIKLQYGFECDQHKRALLRIIYEDAAGETVYTASFPEDGAKFEDVIPDTTGEAWLQAACKIAIMQRAAGAKP
jgi:surface-adhesin protein E